MDYSKTIVPVLGIHLDQFIFILYPTLLIPAIYLWITNHQRQTFAANNPKGCKRLGIHGRSNLDDEYDAKYDEGVDESQWRVKALMVHPIKSCAPVELDEMEIVGAGPTWDRKFAFAELVPQTKKPGDPESTPQYKWQMRTLRKPGWEKMALIRPEVWIPQAPPTKDKSALTKVEQTGALIVKYPFIPSGPLAFLDRLFIRIGLLSPDRSFQVPLTPPEDHKYPRELINVFFDNPHWFNYKQHIPADFQQFIGAKNPITLFRADPESYRQLFRNAPRKAELGRQAEISFPDAYPVNLLNLTSVHDIASKVVTPNAIPKGTFTCRRFRPNILIAGPKAYDEDDWKRMKVGNFGFYASCHTVRCRLPNVDPNTATRHPIEPDKTLKTYRRIDPGSDKNGCLGMQLVPADATDITLRVGDKIVVEERGEHLYIKPGPAGVKFDENDY